MSLRRSLVLVSVSVLAACKSTPMPGPCSPEAGGLAIQLKIRAPIKMFSQRAEQVLFVRLPGPGGSPAAGEQIVSNYEKDGYVYLLNAPPGTYVAVAGFKEMESAPLTPVTLASSSSFSVSYTYQPGPTNYTTYFPEDMIRATQVTVSAGSITFCGDFVVDQHVGLEGADPTQHFFYAQFGDGDEDENLLENAFGGDYHYRGTLHEASTNVKAVSDFREDEESRVVEAGWSLVP